MLRRIIGVLCVSTSVSYIMFREIERRKYVREMFPYINSTSELPLLPFCLSQNELNVLVVNRLSLISKMEDKYLNNSLVEEIFTIDGDINEFDKSNVIVGRVINCMQYCPKSFQQRLDIRLRSEMQKREELAYLLEVNGYSSIYRRE